MLSPWSSAGARRRGDCAGERRCFRRSRAVRLDVDLREPLALLQRARERIERNLRQLVELVGEGRAAVEHELVHRRHAAGVEQRGRVLAGKLGVVGFGQAAVDVGHRGDELVLERLDERRELEIARHLADGEQVQEDVLVPVDVGLVVGALAVLDLLRQRVAPQRGDDHAGARAPIVDEVRERLDRFAARLLGGVGLREPGADAGGDDAIEDGRDEREGYQLPSREPRRAQEPHTILRHRVPVA